MGCRWTSSPAGFSVLGERPWVHEPPAFRALSGELPHETICMEDLVTDDDGGDIAGEDLPAIDSTRWHAPDRVVPEATSGPASHSRQPGAA